MVGQPMAGPLGQRRKPRVTFVALEVVLKGVQSPPHTRAKEGGTCGAAVVKRSDVLLLAHVAALEVFVANMAPVFVLPYGAVGGQSVSSRKISTAKFTRKMHRRRRIFLASVRSGGGGLRFGAMSCFGCVNPSLRVVVATLSRVDQHRVGRF